MRQNCNQNCFNKQIVDHANWTVNFKNIGVYLNKFGLHAVMHSKMTWSLIKIKQSRFKAIRIREMFSNVLLINK